MRNKNVIDTATEMEYIVDLRNGNIVLHMSSDVDISDGPYSYYKNFYQADLFSLNILRQNANEEMIKTDKFPTTMARDIMGYKQTITTNKIVPTMQWLQDTYPEKFI